MRPCRSERAPSRAPSAQAFREPRVALEVGARPRVPRSSTRTHSRHAFVDDGWHPDRRRQMASPRTSPPARRAAALGLRRQGEHVERVDQPGTSHCAAPSARPTAAPGRGDRPSTSPRASPSPTTTSRTRDDNSGAIARTSIALVLVLSRRRRSRPPTHRRARARRGLAPRVGVGAYDRAGCRSGSCDLRRRRIALLACLPSVVSRPRRGVPRAGRRARRSSRCHARAGILACLFGSRASRRAWPPGRRRSAAGLGVHDVGVEPRSARAAGDERGSSPHLLRDGGRPRCRRRQTGGLAPSGRREREDRHAVPRRTLADREVERDALLTANA